jgi:hypothetical protein
VNPVGGIGIRKIIVSEYKCPWKFLLFALCDEFRIRDDFQGVFRKGPIIKSSNKDTGSFTSKKIRNDRICSKNVMTPFCTLVLLV